MLIGCILFGTRPNEFHACLTSPIRITVQNLMVVIDMVNMDTVDMVNMDTVDMVNMVLMVDM